MTKLFTERIDLIARCPNCERFIKRGLIAWMIHSNNDCLGKNIWKKDKENEKVLDLFNDIDIS